jgi:hypothetical protein
LVSCDNLSSCPSALPLRYLASPLDRRVGATQGKPYPAQSLQATHLRCHRTRRPSAATTASPLAGRTRRQCPASDLLAIQIGACGFPRGGAPSLSCPAAWTASLGSTRLSSPASSARPLTHSSDASNPSDGRRLCARLFYLRRSATATARGPLHGPTAACNELEGNSCI